MNKASIAEVTNLAEGLKYSNVKEIADLAWAFIVLKASYDTLRTAYVQNIAIMAIEKPSESSK